MARAIRNGFMIIRLLRKQDLKQVFGLYMEGYEERNFTDVNRLKKPSPKTIPRWSKRILEDIKNKHLIFLVAAEGEKIMGFCFVKKKDIPDSELSHVGVLGVRVNRQMRGRGIGGALIKEAVRRSRSKFEIIELEVMSINKAGIHLYNKYGFKRWGVMPNAVKRGDKYIDMEHMYLRLR
jgi:ribosomal protein S18 acetylase RimI-like enzyme